MSTATPSSVSLTWRLSEFFYQEEYPYGLVLIRITLPLVLLCVVIPRWTHSRELYSTDGVVAPIAEAYGYTDFLPVPSPGIAVAMMTALAFFLVTSSIGWYTRFSLWASWGLYTYLNMLDSLSTLTKYSVISSHVLLLLAVSRCGANWSVDAIRAPRIRRRYPCWPRRLVQLLIGLVYFGAAFTKLHTDGFASGDQIRFWLLTNLNRENPLGEALAMYPAVIVAMGHVALVFQVVFIFLCWRGYGRAIMLGLGATFHLSTVWLLGLFIFPPVMLATYLAWFDEEDAWRLHRVFRKQARRFRRGACEVAGWVSGSIGVGSDKLFAATLLVLIMTGLAFEHSLDLYGQRHAEGQYVLAEMTPERKSKLFVTTPRMRESDKFFSLETGTDLLGGTVVNRTSTFSVGEKILAQVCLVPPHDDLMMRCSIEDASGNEVHSIRRAATRDMLRVTFSYWFAEDAKPGAYRIVISSKDERVLWRDVTVTNLNHATSSSSKSITVANSN